MTPPDITAAIDRLDRIEATLRSLVAQKAVKEWYSVDQAVAGSEVTAGGSPLR